MIDLMLKVAEKKPQLLMKLVEQRLLVEI
jgi:hypothetical protein